MTNERNKITLFGDSITRRSFDVDNGCWASCIANDFCDSHDVDVRGFESYNTKLALAQMSSLFPESYLAKVDCFVIFFGHNDSWEEASPQHVPVEDFVKNIRQMIDYLEDNGLERDKMILVTPSWYHEDSFKEYVKKNDKVLKGKKFEDVKKYSEALLLLAKNTWLRVVDFFTISNEQEPLEDIFCDGLHLSKKGAVLLANQLIPLLDKQLRWPKPEPINYDIGWTTTESEQSDNES